MVDKVDTLLQTMQLDHYAHVPLLVIDNQFDLLLAFPLVQLAKNLRESQTIRQIGACFPFHLLKKVRSAHKILEALHPINVFQFLGDRFQLLDILVASAALLLRLIGVELRLKPAKFKTDPVQPPSYLCLSISVLLLTLLHCQI